jgi:hypothetical protein
MVWRLLNELNSIKDHMNQPTPLPGTYPKELKSVFQGGLSIVMLTAALVTISVWKQLQWPLTEERKLVCTYKAVLLSLKERRKFFTEDNVDKP